MKRNIFLYGIAVVLGCTVLGMAYVGPKLNGEIPHYDTPPIKLTVQLTLDRIERGRLLASALCNHCHQNPVTKQLSGIRMLGVEAAFGEVYTPNITQHPTKGIGAWSDGELAYLFRTGIKRDGSLAHLIMPRWAKISDEDLFSIIAFLRSDDASVQAADVDSRPNKPSLLVSFLMNFIIKPREYPTKAIPEPDTTNAVSYGRYLAIERYGCYACHSASFASINEVEPVKSELFFGGNTSPQRDVNDREVFAPNITPNREHGIGSWSEADFVRAMRYGFAPLSAHSSATAGTMRPLDFPMQKYTELTDNDLHAMYSYLRTVPPLTNPRRITLQHDSTTIRSAGQRLYYHYRCQTCHGESGAGWGILTAANIKYPTDEILVDVLKHPQQYLGEKTKMPSWDGVIKEQDYKDLCGYVRELSRKATQ